MPIWLAKDGMCHFFVWKEKFLSLSLITTQQSLKE